MSQEMCGSVWGSSSNLKCCPFIVHGSPFSKFDPSLSISADEVTLQRKRLRYSASPKLGVICKNRSALQRAWLCYSATSKLGKWRNGSALQCNTKFRPFFFCGSALECKVLILILPLAASNFLQARLHLTKTNKPIISILNIRK